MINHGFFRRMETYLMGCVRGYKELYNVQNLAYPAQSPDFNPTEGIRAILEERT
jgi:hypothetical protein